MTDVDLTKYPDGLLEVIKYVDFLPTDDPQEKIAFVLMAYFTGVAELYI